METIFEHNVTKEELIYLFGSDRYKREDFLEDGQINNYGLIYSLYYGRGDMETAEKYLAKIPNSDWKNFQLANHDH